MTTWNPSDKSANVTLSGGNLSVSATDPNPGNVRGTAGYATGRKVFKYTITLAPDTVLGIANSTCTLTAYAGADAGGVAYNSNAGVVDCNSVSIGTAATSTNGDVLLVAVDFALKRIWFKVNSGNWNNVGGNNPDTNTGGFTYTSTGTMFPLWGGGGAGGGLTDSGTANFLAAGGHGLTTFLGWDEVAATLLGQWIM